MLNDFIGNDGPAKMMNKQDQDKDADNKKRNPDGRAKMRDRSAFRIASHHHKRCDQKQDAADKDAKRVLGFVIAHKVADHARAQRSGGKGQNHHRDRQGKCRHGDNGGQQGLKKASDRFDFTETRQKVRQAIAQDLLREGHYPNSNCRPAQCEKQGRKPQAIGQKFPDADQALNHDARPPF